MSDIKVVSTLDKVVTVQVGVQGPAGPSVHGALSELLLDQHPQYHNNERGDVRYAPIAHVSDSDNPHAVTKAQVGLGNADNTSDVDKPVSTAQAAADAAVLAASDPIGSSSSAVSAHAAGSGVHTIAAVTGLQTALDSKSGTAHNHAGVYDPAGAADAAQAAATAASAPASKGVTDGDSHAHTSGHGAQISYSSLSALPTLGSAAALDVGMAAGNIVRLDGSAKLPAVDGSQLTHLPVGGVSDHGALTGLADDDHPQYHTDGRGDARYSPLAHASNTSNPHSVTAGQVGADASGTASAAVSAHAGGSSVHAIASVTGLQTALDGKSPTSHNHDVTYAPIVKGVTNGDSHDHNGGDGAQIAYSTLSGLPTLGSAAATNTTAYEAAGGISTHAALTTTHGISTFGATLVDDTSASVARTTLGLGGAAILNVGTTTGTVAAGDDSRIVASTAAETTTTIGSLIASATAKTTPVDADSLGLSDSAAANVLKKLSWANLKTALQTIFATLAGTTGGQTLRGGTSASETLTLQSTSHATKGVITALPVTIDEANLRVGIGQVSPTAALHIKAGTAAVSTAPLKFTSGTLLTTPESGAMEYLSGTHYLTNSTPVRRAIASVDYALSAGANLCVNGFGEFGDNTGFSGATYSVSSWFDTPSFYKSTGSLTSDQYIAVSPDNSLRITMSVAAGDVGGGNYSSSLYYIGLCCYDADKNLIEPKNVFKVLGSTDTTLAVALNPGDTTVTLTDATGWYNSSSVYSRTFTWYPYTSVSGISYAPYTYSRNVASDSLASYSINGVWAQGGISGNVITLTAPWPSGVSLPVGTKVRNSRFSGDSHYCCAYGSTLPNAVTKISGTMNGTSIDGSWSQNKFDYGTKFVRMYAGTTVSQSSYYSKIMVSRVSCGNLEDAIGVGANYKISIQSALPTNGLAVEGKIGAGTLGPAAFVSGYGTTEQARSSYDATTYVGTLVSSTGLVTQTLAGTAAGIKWLYSDATTNAIYALAMFSKNTSGTGAAGLGLSITLAAKSSTTVDSPQVTLTSSWVDATHATRTARGTLNAIDYNATREAIRWESDGTVARLGFFGATAVVKPTSLTATVAAAPAGGTGTAAGAWDTSGNRDLAIATINNLKARVDQLESNLQALGLLT